MLQGDKATEHRSLLHWTVPLAETFRPDSMQLQVAQMREMLKSLVHDMKVVKGKLVSDEGVKDSDAMKDTKNKLTSGNDDKDSEISRLVLRWQ